MTALPRLALLVLCALPVLPATAAASVTVTSSGTTVTIAGDADADQVDLAFDTVGAGDASTDGVLVTNPAGVVAVPPCVPASGTSASCPGTAIDASLGAGDDRLGGGDLFFFEGTIRGEGGRDTLTGTGSGTVDGGPDDDLLLPEGFGDELYTGGAGTDVLRLTGGEVTVGAVAGDDFGTRADPDVERFEGSTSFDDFSVGPNAGSGHAFSGGGGEDSISYFSAGGPARVTLDGVANDGVGARTDSVGSDIEQLVGGSGDDTLVGNDGENGLFGLGGNDTLLGDAGDGGSADRVSGGAGDDTVEGRGGADDVFGGTGTDRLSGGGGGDTLAGGEGADVIGGGADGDTVSYADRDDGVTVTLGDGRNDGTSGEGDDVGGDVESVRGTFEADTLTGSDGDNELRGGGGADRIDGRGGNDKLSGDFGDDVLTGGAGTDELRGGAGGDAMDGQAGEDVLITQERSDEDFGDSDDGTTDVDVLEMRDGERDTAVCSAGLARVLADQFDLVAPSCALVERATFGQPAAPGQPVASGLIPPPPVRIVRQRVRVDRRGVARIKASCPPGPACSGVLTLLAKRRKAEVPTARSVFAIPAARKRTVRIRLTKLGRRLLRARKVLRVEVAVAADAPNAAPPARLVALRLRKAKRRR